jgi:uncharacterized protein (TIGR00369 family)
MDPERTFAETPVNGLLSLRLCSRSAERVEVELDARPELAQEAGVVHGGLLALLADTAAVYLLWPDLPADRTLTSIEFKLNFLAAGRPGGPPLRAVATVLRKGRTVAVCESEVFQDGRRLCKGTFTYLQYERPTPP